jgi:hypothetical protein
MAIGQKDITAVGKDAAPPEVRAKLGHYRSAAAKSISHATLVEFGGLGHAPQMQDSGAFHKSLLEGLAAVASSVEKSHRRSSVGSRLQGSIRRGSSVVNEKESLTTVQKAASRQQE